MQYKMNARRPSPATVPTLNLQALVTHLVVAKVVKESFLDTPIALNNVRYANSRNT